ncbi:MAG TPA: hypothetical protein VI408_02950 [Gaiellaceae bacterium]
MRKALVLAAVAGALFAAPNALAAGWCGSGETPTDRTDVVTGRQIHAVWAVPSDGADTFATGAPRIADDINSILSWWQGQDPTRVPRFDTAAFPGGTCADISFVQLPRTGAQYAALGASGAFNRMSTDLENVGYFNPFKKYLVYYDGPSVESGVCGTGGGDFATGPSFAFVWLSGCAGVSSDNVGAHELLHALGALPEGAPHACPGDTGHPCDSTQDILYPYNNGLPLAQEILDVNHDDYYAHSGTWIDIQDSPWLHLLNVAPVALTLALSGSGHVKSDVPGVDCSASCTTQWDPGSSFTLVADPPAGSRLVKWQGACTGSLDCSISSMSAPASVTAVFGPSRIAVRVRVTGKGRVQCRPACSSTFVAGNSLTLRAVASPGWRFVRWAGACTGTGLVCRPKTDYAVTARATFRQR